MLLFSGLALNPLALAHFFADNPPNTRVVLALQVALIVGGGWGLWRRSTLHPIPSTLAPAAIATLGSLIALGVYGTTKSLQKAQQHQQLLATLDRSENLLQQISAQALPLLASDIHQGQLPTAPVRSLFADTVITVDLEPSVETTAATTEIQRQLWPTAPPARLATSDIQLWSPLFAKVHTYSYAKFHIESADFLDAEERTYQTQVSFDAQAQTMIGEHAQIHANLSIHWQQEPGGNWQIHRWETESMELLTRTQPLFIEVLDQALPRDEDRTRARTSHHADLVRQSFRDSTFIGPHRYFTRQAYDRHPGISVVDIDSDGFDDIYVAVRRGNNMLWHNRGDGTFVERASDFGLDIENHTSCALFADFDNDGDQDALLGRTLVPSLYLINENGRFVERDLGTDVLPTLVASISTADYNQDGLLDVYFSTYAMRMMLDAIKAGRHADPLGGGELLADFLPAGLARQLYRLSYDRIGNLAHDAPGPPNILLHNIGAGDFAPAATAPSNKSKTDRAKPPPHAHHASIWRNTLQATWADFDLDGDPDLYLANDFAANNLLRNDGGAFVDITTASGTADLGFGMGASWGDYDANGRQDLYVTNMHSSAGRRVTAAAGHSAAAFAPLARGNSLFRNDTNGFTRVSGVQKSTLPVENGGWGWGGQFVDFDNDGDLDIYAPNGYYTPPREVAIAEDS